MEQEFVVRPGADATQVHVAYKGIQGLEVAKDGSLVIRTADGEMHESEPRIYQEIAGKRVPVKGSFKLDSETAYTFEVSSYRTELALVIDPTLLYSTYLGGTGDEQGKGIAVDSSGNAYVTGTTGSADFPTTPGSLRPTFGGGSAFVSKLSALGNTLVYSTYLGIGGNSLTLDPRAYAIAVDSAGEAYVTSGYAGSGFPTTGNAFQQSCNDSVFLTKLTAKGDGVVYSTCLGSGLAGIEGAGGYAVAVSGTGNAYITGIIGANGFPTGSFPTTAGAFQSQPPSAARSAFVAVLNPFASGNSSLIYSTYLGGVGIGIAVDPFGMTYVTGSTGPTFPVTPGAFITTFPALCCSAAFVAKLNPTASGASSLIYSTFLGGNTGTAGARASPWTLPAVPM